MAALPDAESPDRKLPFNESVVYAGVSLPVYMVMSQLPLYGIKFLESSDRLDSLRVVMASNRGTLTELGIIPILTYDHALFSGAQKLLAALLAATQALILAFTGLDGNLNDTGVVGCGLLTLQLVLSSTVIMLMDGLMQKDYVLGSEINTFVASNVCQTAFWKFMTFYSVPTYRGSEYEGAIVSIFHLIGSCSNKIRELKDAFYHPGLPNAMNAIATLSMFALITYLLKFRVELSIKSNRMRSQRAYYPIRLFYTSGSIIYYLSAPHGLTDAIFYLVHTLIYASFTAIVCAYLSKLWTDVSGSSSRDVVCQLKDQQVTLLAFMMFQWATLAIASVLADVLGSIGAGPDVLISVLVIFQYFEMLAREQSEGNLSMENMLDF
ncbi:hypothetical protein G6F43_002130 [Rhizopus delemar]|nr:hypothetical protein G6F43_002130 [Rhizopus delemar]